MINVLGNFHVYINELRLGGIYEYFGDWMDGK
jgi:hypothetical protein